VVKYPIKINLRDLIDKLEESYIYAYMNYCKGNKKEAAEYLSIPRTVLLYKLEYYGMKEFLNKRKNIKCI